MAGAKRTPLPALECNDLLAEAKDMRAANRCELDMVLKVPAGADVDNDESMLSSLNVLLLMR